MTIGKIGSISTTKAPDGRWRGSCRFRGQDGVVRTVSVFRLTKSAAHSDVLERAQELAGRAIAAAGIDSETTLRELAAAWLADIDDGTRKPQSIHQYRHQIETRLNPGLGSIRVREATTGRLDTFVQSIAKSSAASAKTMRTVLNGMMGLAARHDALPQNTARDTKSVKVKAGSKRTLVQHEDAVKDEVHQLREQVRKWQAGEAIPGRDAAPIGGQRRSQDVVAMVDVFLATGIRPAELLALRWSDIDLKAEPARITVSGTLVTLPAAEGGLIRQDTTKTKAGHRIHRIPDWCRDSLLERQVNADANTVDAVFPSQVGGWRSPNNFRRIWRDVRGDNFEWVTPKSFRKTVGTEVSTEKGDEAAALQLGQADGGRTARVHYINRPTEAPDQTDVLAKFGPRKV